MKKSLFVRLTVFAAAVKCLRLLWAALPDEKRKSKSTPQRKGSEGFAFLPFKKVPRVEHQTERAVVPVSLLTPAPPDDSPKVRLYGEALASLACAEPGELVLIATIPPGTVLTTALLERLDMKVVHRDQLADLIGWGFVRVEKAH